MTISFRRQRVLPRFPKLLHLGKNPGIGGRGPPDHYPVTTGLFDHARRVFGALNVAIADNRDSDRPFDGGDDPPIGSAGLPLQARARMHGSRFDADLLRHFHDFHGDNRLLVPTGAQFDC